MNRREIIRLIATAPVGMSLSTCRHIVPVAIRESRLPHGLLFDADRIPGIRNLYLNHPFFVNVRREIESIDRNALRRFIASELRLNDQLTDLRRLEESAVMLALHFLLTGDVDAGELAAACIRAMMRFPKWDYFLDGDDVIGIQRAPAAAIAVALTSDWLGDSITADERRDWLIIMGQRGCEPCYRALYDITNPLQVSGWRFDPESTLTILRPGNYTDLNRRPEITASTNLRAIPACGLIVGAGALMDLAGSGSKTEVWNQLGADTLRAFGDIFKKDGSYHEGVSYANYTAEHLTQAMTVLWRKQKIDLRDEVNWNGYVNYVTNMSMPTSADPAEIVNFGDNGNSKTGESGSVKRTFVPFWIARHTRSELAQWFGKSLGGEPDLRALLFYDDNVHEQGPQNRPTLWESDLDWIVARSGYRADDLVVAMRSGGPANHEHADRNSIIVKCYGEQLVTDPYRPPYSFSDPSWRMRLTEAHSAVLIDGQGHEHHNGVEGTNASQSWARIVTSEHNARFSMWTSDASQPYRLVDLKIASVVRTVVVLYDLPAVVVVDRVVKRENAATVQARFFGFNWDKQVKQGVSADGFTIVRPGATIRATCFCNNGLSIRSGKLDIVDERAQRHPFVEVGSSEPGMETTIVTAMGIGRTSAAAARATIEQTDQGILIRLSGSEVRVALDHDITVVSK